MSHVPHISDHICLSHVLCLDACPSIRCVCSLSAFASEWAFARTHTLSLTRAHTHFPTFSHLSYILSLTHSLCLPISPSFSHTLRETHTHTHTHRTMTHGAEKVAIPTLSRTHTQMSSTTLDKGIPQRSGQGSAGALGSRHLECLRRESWVIIPVRLTLEREMREGR